MAPARHKDKCPRETNNSVPITEYCTYMESNVHHGDHNTVSSTVSEQSTRDCDGTKDEQNYCGIAYTIRYCNGWYVIEF